MVWRIHSWCPESGAGTVVSPHFGPWAFGPDENPFGTDFEVGEEVLVELDGPKGAYVVRAVTAARQRQPEGTACPAFAGLNAGTPGELRIDEWTEVELRFWAGDCCEWCSLEWWIVTFEHPITYGLDADTDLDNPLLRYASPAEREEHRLLVPEGSRAYCIVTGYGIGREGPPVFIIAPRVAVEHRRSKR